LERLNLFAVVVDRHVADVVDAALSVPGLVEGFPGPVTLIKVLRNSRHVGSLGVGLRRTRVQKGRGLRGSGPPVRLSVLTFTDRTGYRMRTLGACPVCARLHPARPPGRSPLRSHRRTCVVCPNALTDRVPKGCSEGFCHFWHLVILRFSRSTRPSGGPSSTARMPPYVNERLE
jgi:hypothetical protein